MARVLITGASGFVGWNATRRFVVRGHEVVAGFHTLPHYLHTDVSLTPVELDVADGVAVEEVVARFQPDLILHAAARARPQIDTDVVDVYAVNVLGSEHLARASSRYDIPIVYISTDLVYASDAGVCTEETAISPTSANTYAETKALGEERVRDLGGRWAIIRAALMYGNGTPRAGGFTRFIDTKWRAGESAPLFTDQFRSFLYVGDLCAAIEQVAFITPTWNELFVCGGDERLSRGEFGLRYAAAVGIDPAMCRLMNSTELEGYVGGPSDITLDASKLRGLGWRARAMAESFEEMLTERRDIDDSAAR